MRAVGLQSPPRNNERPWALVVSWFLNHFFRDDRLRRDAGLEVAVCLQTCTGRNQLADDDVLLQTDQMVDLALDGGVGQNLRRLLEGSCGEPGLGRQRSLRDAHENQAVGGKLEIRLARVDARLNLGIGVDKKLLKNMFGFAGWNFIGAASSVLRDQGGNVVINLFFGPSVNAAKGIAMQVNSAISGFVSNFMTALNPQITKSYASGNQDYMMALIFQGAKFSFYMLLLLSLPVIINTHYILGLWLKLVPEHAVLFVRLTLLFAMSESISNPLITAMLATGRIRNYQIMVGGLQMLNLPISYIFLRLGCVPESVLFVAIFISQCCLVARLYMLRGMIGLSSVKYLKHVYLKVLMVMSTSAILPILLLKNINETFLSFLVISVVSILTTSISIFYIGCSKEERVFVWAKVSALCAKIRR